jgi:hypothetical protein
VTDAPKTYKREVSCGMLVFLGVFHVLGLWKPEAVQIAQYLTTPVFMFAAAAFGVDAYAKQVLKQ